MKNADTKIKIINKLLPYKMQFEKCWGCGGETFFVIFTNFKSLKPTTPEAAKKLFEKFPSLKPKDQIKKKVIPFPFDLSTDVQFWCGSCGEMSSGVFFNEEMVDMKSQTKKNMTLEKVLEQEKEEQRQMAIMKRPIPK